MKLKLVLIAMFLSVTSAANAAPRADTINYAANGLSQKITRMPLPQERLLKDGITGVADANILGKVLLNYSGGIMPPGAITYVGDGQPLNRLVVELTTQQSSGPGIALPPSLRILVAWGEDQATIGTYDYFTNNIFTPASTPPEIEVTGSALSGTVTPVGTWNGFNRWRVSADLSPFYLQYGLKTTVGKNHWLRFIVMGEPTYGDIRVFVSAPQPGRSADYFGYADVFMHFYTQWPKPIGQYFAGTGNYLAQVYTKPESGLLMMQ